MPSLFTQLDTLGMTSTCPLVSTTEVSSVLECLQAACIFQANVINHDQGMCDVRMCDTTNVTLDGNDEIMEVYVLLGTYV